MGAREVLELVIKGDAKGAIDAFRGTEKAADGAEQSVSRSGAMFDKLTQRFPIAGRAAEKFGIDAGNAGTVATRAAQLTAGAVAAFAVKAVGDFTAATDGVLKFQRATQLSAEESSRWVAVADDYGLSAEQVAASVGKFEKAVATTPGKLAELGVEIRKNADGTTDLQGTLLNAATAYNATQDATKKAALGNALFGKSWQDMVPLLEKGASGLEEAFEGVEQAQIFSKDDLKNGEEMRLQMDAVQDAIQGVALQLGKFLVPVLADAAAEAEPLLALMDKMSSSAGKQGTGFAEASKKTREYGAAIAGFTSGINILANRQEEQRRKQEEATLAQVKATHATLESVDADKLARDTRETAAEATERLAEEAAALEEQTRKNEDAAKHLARAEDERAEATRNAYRAALEASTPTLQLRAAERELADQLDDVTVAAKDAARAKNDDGKAARELQAQQDGLVGKLAEVAAQYANTTGAAQGSTEWAQAYASKLIELKGTYADALGPAQAEYDKIIARLQEVIRQQKLANQTAAGYFPGSAGSSVGGPKREGATSSFGPTVETSGFGRPAAPVAITINTLSSQGVEQAIMDGIARYERVNGTGWRSS